MRLELEISITECVPCGKYQTAGKFTTFIELKQTWHSKQNKTKTNEQHTICSVAHTPTATTAAAGALKRSIPKFIVQFASHACQQFIMI